MWAHHECMLETVERVESHRSSCPVCQNPYDIRCRRVRVVTCHRVLLVDLAFVLLAALELVLLADARRGDSLVFGVAAAMMTCLAWSMELRLQSGPLLPVRVWSHRERVLLSRPPPET